MKNIKDYFVSPQKKVQSEELDKNSNSCGGTTSEILENTGTENPPKGKKKKNIKKRKPTDPAVKDLTELLSVACLNKSAENDDTDNKETNSEEKEKLEKAENEDIVIIVDESSANNDCLKTPKVNAFQVLMDSRNKSIGQNSCGKERDDDDEVNKETKQKLLARKNLLENWANSKGAIKRKREEEEKDVIINQKLEKRAKRLKKLLDISNSNKKTEENIKNRNVRVLSSDSSSSEFENKTHEERVIVNKTEISLVDFSESDFDEDNTKKENIIKIKMFTPKTVKKKKNTEEPCSKSDEKVETPIITVKIKQKFKDKKTDKTEIPNSVVKTKEKIKDNPKEEIDTKHSNDSSDFEEQTLKRIIHKNVDNDKNKCKSENKKKELKKPMKKSNDSDKKLNKRKSTISSEQNDSIQSKDNIVNNEDLKVANENPNETEQVKPYSFRLRKPKPKNEIFDDSSFEEKTELKKPKTTSKKNKSTDEVIIESTDEEYGSTPLKSAKKNLKVAPVFVKSLPKPKEDPEVVEARRQFLMSGIPSSLRKNIEKQQSIEETEVVIFPEISHIQQKCGSQFWSLSSQSIPLVSISPLTFKTKDLESNMFTKSHLELTKLKFTESEKINEIKHIIAQIKKENPEYPVYKSFKSLFEKSGKIFTDKESKVRKTPKQKRKSKQKDGSAENSRPNPTGSNAEYSMWSEKYKPQCSADILGNNKAVTSLKNWLEKWTTARTNKDGYSSSSEFEASDADSRDSTRLLENTIILIGPNGTGKTSAVYAVCNEFGFNVLELNASSKRTGKKLLQELQEATQSHQVRKNGELRSLFNLESQETPKDDIKPVQKKKCVLLIEDIDIVFEQDDGFITSLSQLISTSKRPVILTTTDPSSLYVRKFLEQHDSIHFTPIGANILATWLQILCVIEGILVNRNDISILLDYNCGDVRRTLLQLQFWVQSGGEIFRNAPRVKIQFDKKRVSTDSILSNEDCEVPITSDKCDENSVFEHSNCISSFEVFKSYKLHNLPRDIGLGFVWWNIPNIFNKTIGNNQEGITNKRNSLDNRINLSILSNFCDSLSVSDIIHSKMDLNTTCLEPTVKHWSTDVRRSLELNECLRDFRDTDYAQELTHTLLDGYIEEFNSNNDKDSHLNMAVPTRESKRWRTRLHCTLNILQEAVPVCNYVDRKSVTLDYYPSLRNMARSEDERSSNNTKRGRRFRHYLKDFCCNINETNCKVINSMLSGGV